MVVLYYTTMHVLVVLLEFDIFSDRKWYINGLTGLSQCKVTYPRHGHYAGRQTYITFEFPQTLLGIIMIIIVDLF